MIIISTVQNMYPLKISCFERFPTVYFLLPNITKYLFSNLLRTISSALCQLHALLCSDMPLMLNAVSSQLNLAVADVIGHFTG